MMNARFMLETEDVSRSFGGVKANVGITLRLREGEIRGLIGPNGAGKTTLLNGVTGVYPPDSGTILLDGRAVNGLSPMQISRLGMLRTFQVPKLFASMTIRENLMVPVLARNFLLAGARARRAQEQADHLLELTSLQTKQTALAKTLSGGEQQLVQVAVGFMVDDLKCYLLDEPFAGVNPVLTDRIVQLVLHENRSRGVTFLVISHEMGTIRALCPYVTVLADGRVLTEGTMDEVVAHPDVIDAYLGKRSA
jgi:ABC-type branched-subunit amino acid transport system ATPase component